MKKIFICFLSLVLAITASITSVLLNTNHSASVSASAQFKVNRKIIIDAGHGGFDGGAVAGDGTSEKDINLNISLLVGQMLSLSGFEVIYTRTEDTGTEDNSDASISQRKVSDLNNRLTLMSEHPDSIFVSIHLNKFTTSSASGAQVFYSRTFEEARELSVSIQNSIVSLIQPDNTRVVKQGTSSTFLLHKAKVPAVIVECGFLSNLNELKLLKSNEYQKQIAFAIYCGILNFYNK